MAVDQRRRQQKLQRKARKQKAQRKELMRLKNEGFAAKLRNAPRAPFLTCLDGSDQGMHSIFVARQLPHGQIALVAFLVDTYCLGVKDVIVRFVSQEILDEMEEEFRERLGFGPSDWTPERALKFIEGAVDFAQGFGLPMHSDYQKALAIFSGVDTLQCRENFHYGDEDGQPLFISGPNDSPEHCHYILRLLEDACGPNGFHFIVGGPAGAFQDMGLMEDWDDDEEEDEDDDDNFERAPATPWR